MKVFTVKSIQAIDMNNVALLMGIIVGFESFSLQVLNRVLKINKFLGKKYLLKK